MSTPLLHVEHVHKSFAAHTALNDVSLTVERGRVFGLLGPNGAGKTTLIRIINRITAPDTGAVYFNGHPLAPEDVANIGYLPEERGLYKKMKVGEQAIYFARLKGLSYREARTRLEHWFERLEIMPWWDKKVEELSKGMQQKVQFVCTVLHEPELLIFDEPFSGFDPVNAERLKQEILQLRDAGHTIIFSTHNMNSVEEICDDIALIHQSQVQLSGQVEDVRQRFRTGLYELVTTDATLSPDDAAYSIVQQQQQGSVYHFILRKNGTQSNSELVRHLAEQVEVRSFAEKMPTMHDIFLQTVTSSSHE